VVGGVLGSDDPADVFSFYVASAKSVTVSVDVVPWYGSQKGGFRPGCLSSTGAGPGAAALLGAVAWRWRQRVGSAARPGYQLPAASAHCMVLLTSGTVP
jgi:hypothetical protein